MTDGLFTAESMAELLTAFKTQFPMAIWETFYVTVLSTALSLNRASARRFACSR